MSSGSSTPPGTRYDIDDAVDELRKLVDLTKLQVDLTRATNYLLAGGPGGGGGSALGGAGGTAGLSRLFKQYFGSEKSNGHVGPQRGIGRWLKAKAAAGWSNSRVRKWGQAGSKVGQGVARSLGMGKGGASKLGKIGGKAGAVAAVVVGVAQAFMKVKQALIDYTDEQMAAAKRLSEVSAAMSNIVAVREINQLFRDIERGERTAKSTGKLQEAENRRKEEENKLGIIVDNAVNHVLAWGNDWLASSIEPMRKGIERIAAAFPALFGGPVEESGLASTMAETLASVRAVEARGSELMAIARAEARLARPGPTPDRPAPVGRLP